MNYSFSRRQRGISLVVVVFLLTVVSVMTISMMNLTGTQHISSAYSIRGAQAYFAARSGMEHAIERITAGAACVSPLTVAGFNVQVACNLLGTFDEGTPANTYSIYEVTLTASDGNFQVPDIANRRITATVKFP